MAETNDEPPVQREASGREKSKSKSNSSQEVSTLAEIGSRCYNVVIPVTFCCMYAVFLIQLLSWHDFSPLNNSVPIWESLGMGLVESGPEVSLTTIIFNSLIVVGVLIFLMLLVTLVILLMLNLGYQSCLRCYFYVPTLIVMCILSPIFVIEVCASMNWYAPDLITMIIMTWNFGLVGMIAIHNVYASSPLWLQQFYLIHNSALLSVILIQFLPGWTPWILLGCLVFWDLFAVLAPAGPLKLIINKAENVGMFDMPGLIYTTHERSSSDRNPRESQRRTEPPVNNRSDTDLVDALQDLARNKEPAQAQEGARDKLSASLPRSRDEETAVNIGVGDFIFYSLLVGLNSLGWHNAKIYSTLASLNAIQTGLIVTLVILGLQRRALPALPMSIGLGLLVSSFGACMTRFSNALASEQVFV